MSIQKTPIDWALSDLESIAVVQATTCTGMGPPTEILAINHQHYTPTDLRKADLMKAFSSF